MRNKIKYVLGVDIGIGSAGWAVVRIDGEPRIEDFGARIFESGENARKKERDSQKRRAFRAGRRLIRRRAHRKQRIRFWFNKKGLASEREIKAFFESGTKDLISLRVRALDEEITPTELAACMIHICNRRGYLGFYDIDAEDETEDKESKETEESVKKVREMLAAGNYRTVAEMIKKDEQFSEKNSAFRRYRNREGYQTRYIMPREEVEKEARMILESQRRFCPAIDEEFIDKILGIIFSQRDFEDGPGDPNDKNRPYGGFIDSEGMCRFYTGEKRGHRFTYLSDRYALVNVLSQYRYFDAKTGEVKFTPELARVLLSKGCEEGKLTVNDVKALTKEFGIKVNIFKTDKKDSITAATKYLKAVKPLFTEAGFDWDKLISEDASDMQCCLLNLVGEVLSENITPRRRRGQLKKIAALAEKPLLIEKLTKLKLSGTCNVSYKFMEGAVTAFLNGDIYGKFQADTVRDKAETANNNRHEKLPPFNEHFEFYKNPVVMRSIAETRKAINRIIEEYGSPYAINVEVGSDLNRSFDAREKITSEQGQNEKRRSAAKKEIAELLGISDNEVSSAMVERYFLGEEQNWQCMYSGRPIDKSAALRNSDKAFEVDHIVPFSLVLDNTLHNKALVYHNENQAKGQRVPLEYLTGEAEREFRKRVNNLFGKKKISERKYNYLMLKSVFDSEMTGIWKSRNLNDMRYISRFMVKYLNDNLKFREPDADDPYRPEVYAVKGAITSQMRKLWLNKYTWGREDKGELKKVTYLDHAADAIVVACCMPAYVEMTAAHHRLKQILKNNGGYPNAEYEKTLAAAKENIGKFYHIPSSKLEYYLTTKNARPSLIRDLRGEVDVRLQDVDMINFFESERAAREGRTAAPVSEKAAADKFRIEVRNYYKDDPEFAESLKMPFTVHSVSRKAKGKITDSNAVRMVRDEDNEYFLSRKLVYEMKSKDMKNLYTTSSDLRESLAALFEGRKTDETIGKILGERGEKEFFTAKGTPVRRVTLKTSAKRTLCKRISEKNFSLLTDSSYYCVEIYKDIKGRTKTTGIAFSDITVLGGRVRLKKDYKYPEDYKTHCMYLFTNDYIRVIDKDGRVKFEGYYRSVYSINQNKFYFVRYNTPLISGKCFTLAAKDTVEKFEIDPIGRVGGKIQCGEPLSSVRESE